MTLAGQAPSVPSQTVHLTVLTGTPIRAYLNKRIPKRLGAPVEATTITPVYAFDREAIPAGAHLIGHVSQVQPVPRRQRVRAVLGGDFTPLHIAKVQFTAITLPDGKSMPIETQPTSGLNTHYPRHPPKQKSTSASQPKTTPEGVIGRARQAAKSQMADRVEALKSVPTMVRDPGKGELLGDYLLSRLPYHPQYVGSRTRFDAELAHDLDFGSISLPEQSLADLGTPPTAQSVVPARLITAVDSGLAQKGQVVEALTSRPLFSADNHLILPAGTLLSGSVVNVRKAGWFHHAGRLRLSFTEVKLSPEVQALANFSRAQLASAQRQPSFRTQAALTAAEGGVGPVTVNGEGAVQAKDSNTRFISVGIAVLLSHAGGEGDRDRGPNGALSAPGSNVGGNVIGGGFGFGLFGSAFSQLSPNVGRAFGYYGLAWSVFSNIIAKGREVAFEKNAAVDVGFSARTPPPNPLATGTAPIVNP